MDKDNWLPHWEQNEDFFFNLLKQLQQLQLNLHYSTLQKKTWQTYSISATFDFPLII